MTIVLVLAMSLAAFGEALPELRTETARLQGEIDRVSQSGGGRVVVAKGVHLCGTLYLKSNVELHLEEGAVLRGSSKSDDYDDAIPVNEMYDYENMAPESRSLKAFVFASAVTNVAITGKGMIDGSGPEFFDRNTVLWGYFWAKPKVHRPRMLVMFGCRGVRLEGVTFKDCPVWTMWLRKCEDIVVSRIRIDAVQKMINSDGIDFDACRRVRVGDSHFKTGDDCLVLRAIRRGVIDGEKPLVTEDVVVSNCVLCSACQGVRIGCPSDEVIRNAVFRDMTFTGNNAIFANQESWYLTKGNSGKITTSNILFENWKIDCRGYPISAVVTDGVTLGDFGHMTFRNIEIKSGKPICIRGNKTTLVRDMTLENIRGTIKASPPFEQHRTEGLKASGLDVSGGDASCDWRGAASFSVKKRRVVSP